MKVSKCSDPGRLFASLCPRSAKSWFGVALAVGFLFAVFGCGQGKEAETAASAQPPPEVEVAVVIQRDVPIYSDWVGTTDGLVNAKIRAQVTGYLAKQLYREGSLVKKGDLLFEIDSRVFKTAFDQARGQLAQAKARLGKTELDVKRYTPLAREKAISQQELDDAVQANFEAKAAVQSAEAAVEKARLDLEFTRLVSPIDGIAGAATAQIGDLVGPGLSAELTTVSTLQPIKAYFPVSEQEYMMAVKYLAQYGQSLDTPGPPNLDLILADGSIFPHKGSLSFADRQVDVKTGTIRIAALFPNPDNMLRPGQFARVRALTDTYEKALLVPQRAVTELQGSYMLAIIGPDKKASLRPVKVAERVGNLWVITQGIKPGELVVVAGTQKIKEGQAVNPKIVDQESAPGTGLSPLQTKAAGKEQ